MITYLFTMKIGIDVAIPEFHILNAHSLNRSSFIG